MSIAIIYQFSFFNQIFNFIIINTIITISLIYDLCFASQFILFVRVPTDIKLICEHKEKVFKQINILNITF